eukprot:scaffold109221_cov32-Tisochrysis_lutea.AAC.1
MLQYFDVLYFVNTHPPVLELEAIATCTCITPFNAKALLRRGRDRNCGGEGEKDHHTHATLLYGMTKEILKKRRH